MSTNNEPKGKEVGNDKPKPAEVVKQGAMISDPAVIDDILGIKPAEKVVEADPAKKDAPPQKPENDQSGKEEKKAEPEKPEVTPKADAEKPSTDQPFVKIGDRTFANEAELADFVSHQLGYNNWLTGKVKEIRPDLFNEDGSIKSADLEKAIADKSTKVEKAAETMVELSGVDPEKMTPEQKADWTKARTILKPLGVVFYDDPDFQKLKDKAQQADQIAQERAHQTIAEFEKEHPLITEHYTQVAELMEKRGYTLERAWKVYRAENDIDEGPVKTGNEEASKKEKSVETTIPSSPNKTAGAPPPPSNKDFMDDILMNAGPII